MNGAFPDFNYGNNKEKEIQIFPCRPLVRSVKKAYLCAAVTR